MTQLSDEFLLAYLDGQLQKGEGIASGLPEEDYPRPAAPAATDICVDEVTPRLFWPVGPARSSYLPPFFVFANGS